MAFELTPQEWQAIQLSLKVAAVAMLASLPAGLAVALLLARVEFPGKALVNAVVHLPLVLPPVVTGYILLLLFGRRGPIGAFLAENFGVVFSFRWTGAALACAVMGFPFLVRAMRLSIEAVDRRLEAAAATLGASAPWVFFTVTLPLIIPGIIAGMILCFAKAMGEFGATITFAGSLPGRTQTLPMAVYEFASVDYRQALVLSLVLIVVSVSVLAVLRDRWIAGLTR